MVDNIALSIKKGAIYIMKQVCQSCGMVLSKELMGKSEDGTTNEDYCRYCFPNGKFSKDETLEEMVESCIPFRVNDGVYPNEEVAREKLLVELKALKRWA